jgi:hypothetical protein
VCGVLLIRGCGGDGDVSALGPVVVEQLRVVHAVAAGERSSSRQQQKQQRYKSHQMLMPCGAHQSTCTVETTSSTAIVHIS